MFRTLVQLSLCAGAMLLAMSARAESTNAELRVATFNLRYASDSGPNAWNERRPLIKTVIQTIAPDVMGTQEGLHHQLRDVAADLPAYTWIGRGREGGMRGEFMAIFYRKARLQPLATNHFWLSNTPEVAGSATWGNRTPRMVTWVRFLDRETGGEFLLFNTHLDHQVELARRRSAELIRQRIGALSNGLPAILLGDFNTHNSGTVPHDTLTKDGFLNDAWHTAATRMPENMGTFNGFNSMPEKGPRIDWILSRGGWQIDSVEIVTLRPGNRWASDHFPVVARMRLPGQRR